MPTAMGICRNKNIKEFMEINFTFEIWQRVNERIEVENPCSSQSIWSPDFALGPKNKKPKSLQFQFILFTSTIP